VEAEKENFCEPPSAWRVVIGYRQVGGEDLLDPQSSGPPLWFQQMDAPASAVQSDPHLCLGAARSG
jgi:hypothetical protein